MLKRFVFSTLVLLSCLTIKGAGAELCLGGYEGDLMRDLMIVDEVNKRLNDKLPVYPNHLLYGGYFNMPSALMADEGVASAGFSYVPPYKNYNLRFQFLDRVEISGNYRVFKGIPDPMLTASGFGDRSDKGANIKLCILKPEDSNFVLPGIALGYEDFLGTKGFEARYAVATQVFRDLNFELSLGYGQMRIKRWFGGITWIPFRNHCSPYLKDLALVAEYDAIDYKSKKREPHPDGRTKSSSINYGIKYRLYDFLDFSVSRVRGEEFAYSISASYNIGETTGLLPKLDTALPYKTPKNLQPLGPLRPTDALVQDLIYPFQDQGFELREAWLSCDNCGNQSLRLSVNNCTYRFEKEVRERLNDLLANLIPSNISYVIVVIEEDALPIQEYHYCMKFVRLYGENQLCPYELYILSPLCDATPVNKCQESLLYKDKYSLWNVDLSPKFYTMFGSARGKFKYSLGVHFGLYGFIFRDLYYSVLLGYNFSSNLYDVNDVDKLNPSQIINVRTDTVNYFKQDGITVDEAYLQKNCNLSNGWFASCAAGLFEPAYGGVATEVLYYPAKCCWAVGIEGAYLRKRTYSGIGFADKIRKLNGYKPTFKKYRGSQYFANLYYDCKNMDFELNFKAGKFLANDWGVRSEISKYYPSGFRISFWYTYTDKKDFVNNSRYHDHGVAICLPLDIFYTHPSRDRWRYGLSAWLRDVGAISQSGIPLYYLIRDNRE